MFYENSVINIYAINAIESLTECTVRQINIETDSFPTIICECKRETGL